MVIVQREHDARRARLRAAAAIAAAEPPMLVSGDLLDTIPALVAVAPRGSRVVVFHSSVLVYLEPDRRLRFVELMRSMPDVTWISNEGEHVIRAITEQLTQPANGKTVVAVDGVPLALAGPHGQSYEPL